MPDAFDVSRCPREPVPAITDFGFVTDCTLTSVSVQLLLKDCGDLDIGVPQVSGEPGPEGPEGDTPELLISASVRGPNGETAGVATEKVQVGCAVAYMFHFVFPEESAQSDGCCVWVWYAEVNLWHLYTGPTTYCLQLPGSSSSLVGSREVSAGETDGAPCSGGEYHGQVKIICETTTTADCPTCLDDEAPAVINLTLTGTCNTGYTCDGIFRTFALQYTGGCVWCTTERIFAIVDETGEEAVISDTGVCLSLTSDGIGPPYTFLWGLYGTNYDEGYFGAESFEAIEMDCVPLSVDITSFTGNPMAAILNGHLSAS